MQSKGLPCTAGICSHFWLPLVLFLAVHFALRMFLTGSLEPDDADLAIFGQSLAWGYSEQPPLYSWIAWCVFQVFGLNVFSLTLLRILVLGFVYWSVQACTYYMTRDRLLSIMSSGALLLLPLFAWHSVVYLTHTNLLCGLTVVLFHQVLRIKVNPSRLNYMMLGFLVALGVLTKYNFAIVVFALATAALVTTEFRYLVLSPKMGLAVVITAVVLCPHAMWLATHWDDVAQTIGSRLTPPTERPLWHSIAIGYWELASNVVLISILLLIVYASLFSTSSKAPAANSGQADASVAGRRLLARSFIAVIVWFAVQIPMGAYHVHERWLQHFSMLLPVYLFSGLAGSPITAIQARRYAACVSTLAILLTSGRAVQCFVGGDNLRAIYPMQMRFEDSAQALVAELKDVDFILGDDRVIAGNLRAKLPDVPVLCSYRRSYIPPMPGGSKRCLYVWNTVYGELHPTHEAEDFSSLPIQVAAAGPVHFLDVPSSLPNRRTNRLAYRIVELGESSHARGQVARTTVKVMDF